MEIKFTVTKVNINTRRLLNKVNNDRAFWTFAATEWHRLYEPYVPMHHGTLKDTVSIRPKEIEHTVPYARYQYNGTNFRFRRDKACAKWDKAAAPTQGPKLASAMQKYIDSGRLKLD